MMRGIVVLEREFAATKHAVEESYKLNYPNPIADAMKDQKQMWVGLCREAKGKKIRVGDCYHSAVLGMCKAIVQDTEHDAAVRTSLWKLLLSKSHMEGDENKLDMKKLELEGTFEICSTCSSKIAKEMSYINWTPGKLLLGSPEGQAIHALIQKGLMKYGTRQKNAAPPAPNFTAMEESLMARREWCKGEGKGK